jgi:hypothetical protein
LPPAIDPCPKKTVDPQQLKASFPFSLPQLTFKLTFSHATDNLEIDNIANHPTQFIKADMKTKPFFLCTKLFVLCISEKETFYTRSETKKQSGEDKGICFCFVA